MKKIITTSVLLIVFVCSCKRTVEGYVYDKNGLPVEGIRIFLYEECHKLGSLPESDVTNSSGYYKIKYSDSQFPCKNYFVNCSGSTTPDNYSVSNKHAKDKDFVLE